VRIGLTVLLLLTVGFVVGCDVAKREEDIVRGDSRRQSSRFSFYLKEAAQSASTDSGAVDQPCRTYIKLEDYQIQALASDAEWYADKGLRFSGQSASFGKTDVSWEVGSFRTTIEGAVDVEVDVDVVAEGNAELGKHRVYVRFPVLSALVSGGLRMCHVPGNATAGRRESNINDASWDSIRQAYYVEFNVLEHEPTAGTRLRRVGQWFGGFFAVIAILLVIGWIKYVAGPRT
jgi:hypothetical protein